MYGKRVGLHCSDAIVGLDVGLGVLPLGKIGPSHSCNQDSGRHSDDRVRKKWSEVTVLEGLRRGGIPGLVRLEAAEGIFDMHCLLGFKSGGLEGRALSIYPCGRTAL